MTDEDMKRDEIDARPTKGLFINILTLDIDLKNCVLDLLDNSIDGYIRKRITERREIKMDISPEKFVIFDNCGGIDYEFLKKQVFRFGVEELSRAHATLGIYGIGLKRSIFKIGNNFTMETDDGEMYSKVILNVEKWKKSDKWTIPFTTSGSKLGDGEKPYTRIEITNLHEDVKKKFELISFIEALHETISITYSLIIKQKVNIFLGNQNIEPYPLDFTYSDKYKPSRIRESVDGITVDIICGITPRKTRAEKIDRKGWNIFCNDRLILLDDTTEDTGWSGGAGLPKFHPIYNEFKGLVFLKSTDPSMLPLTTSKNRFDTDTMTYQRILGLMIKQARPVVNYLTKKYEDQNRKLEEIEEEVEDSVEEDIEIDKKSPVEQIEVGTSFLAPIRTRPKEEIVNIQYNKPKKLVNTVKKRLKVRSAKDAGEKTFNYYVEMEAIEYE